MYAVPPSLSEDKLENFVSNLVVCEWLIRRTHSKDFRTILTKEDGALVHTRTIVL